MMFSSAQPNKINLQERSKALPVAIIRREFVDLAGDHFSAVVLNQLLYWTQRVKDFDLLLEEERSFNPECNVHPRHGWIYKTANELIEETMLKATPPTMRKYLKHLIDRGWIDERTHPLDKWKKTTQYRVNLRKLHEDLLAIGHTLPEVYRDVFIFSREEERSKVSLVSSHHDASPEILNSNQKSFPWDLKNYDSKERIFSSNENIFDSYTYTGTTSEIPNKEHTQRTCAREIFPRNYFKKIIEIWKNHIGQEVLLTTERKSQLEPLLAKHLKNDLIQWRALCERIKASPFLMGKGPRGWRVSLDWILNEANLLKVLEGNFDDSAPLECQKSKQIQEEKTKEILASIEDPVWKEWCTQWAHGIWLNPHQALVDSLSCTDLERIANARFLKVEDERLVWIGSSDSKVLNKIEDLRLPLSSIVMRTYPKSRTVRTCLIEAPTDTSQLQKEKNDAQ